MLLSFCPGWSTLSQPVYVSLSPVSIRKNSPEPATLVQPGATISVRIIWLIGTGPVSARNSESQEHSALLITAGAHPLSDHSSQYQGHSAFHHRTVSLLPPKTDLCKVAALPFVPHGLGFLERFLSALSLSESDKALQRRAAKPCVQRKHI